MLSHALKGVKEGVSLPNTVTPWGVKRQGVTGSVTPFHHSLRYPGRGVMGSDVSIDITPSLPGSAVFGSDPGKGLITPLEGVTA